MKSIPVIAVFCLTAWAQAPAGPAGRARPGTSQNQGTAQQSQPAATRPEDMAVVAGQVNNATTGEPLRKVTVSLRRSDSGPGGGPRGYTATTDAAGAFTIGNVEPGQYRLTARRTGFVDVDYGSHDYLHSGAVIKLSPKQRLDNLQMSMPPNAVIAGKIVDEDGDPMANVEVEALRFRYSQGRKQLVSYGSGTTNDIGEYRVARLPAGRYYIAVSLRRGGFGPDRFGRPNTAPETDEYVRTFYPGTTDAAAAAPLDATAGAQLRGVDVGLAKKRTVTVRGRVTDASGTASQPGSRSRIMVFLRPRDLGGAASNRPASVDPAGNFEIHGVAQGAYDLVASIPSRGASLSARMPLDVGHNSIDNLRITINPAVNLTGVVRLDSQTATLGSAVQVTLRGHDSGGPFSGGSPNAKVAADGSFTLAGVNPDSYSLSLSGMPDGCYIKSVRMGNQEVPAADVDVARAAGGALEIVLSPNAGLVTGVVQNDQQQPAAGASVVLVPQEPERREQMQYYKVVTADEAGRFTVKNLDPGQYRVYAWPEVEAGAYMDPDFLRPVENRGESVTVKESGSETVQVKLIS